jgi:hypothetical protein
MYSNNMCSKTHINIFLNTSLIDKRVNRYLNLNIFSIDQLLIYFILTQLLFLLYCFLIILLGSY